MIEAVHQLMAAEDVRAQLRKIPGVVAIGYGLKEKDGQHVSQVAYRVYVTKKKPKHELLPGEIIPSQIGEFITDVLEWQEEEIKSLCCNSPLRPGSQIARYLSDSDEVDSPDNIGTLGCFVQRDGINYLLSNEHVIKGMISYASDEIYFEKKSRPCGSHCNDPISHMDTNKAGPPPKMFSWRDVRASDGVPLNLVSFTTIRHHAAQVDCAIGKLDAKVVFTNQTKEYGAIDPVIRDITGGMFNDAAPDNPPLFSSGTNYLPLPTPVEVQKVGRTTKYTTGNITEVAREVHSAQNSDWITIWEIYVTPTGVDNVNFTITVHDDSVADIPALIASMQTTPVKATLLPGNKIKFVGKTFGSSGDSGSVVVDNNKKVIGLLWGGLTTKEIHLKEPYEGKTFLKPDKGIAAITPIAAVFYKLGLNPASSIIAVSSPSSGAIQPGAIIPQEEAGSRMQNRLNEIDRLLENYQHKFNWVFDGRALLDEARRLVNHHRRCIVAWQRNKGPAFIAATLSALGEEKGIFRKKIGNIELENLLTEMRKVFSETGSSNLKLFLENTGDEIIQFARSCENFDQLVNALTSEKIKLTN